MAWTDVFRKIPFPKIDWSAVSGVASGATSGLLGLFGSRSSALKQYKYQRLLQQQQYDLQRKLNRNSYQDTTYSMRKAGINPMLAVDNGAMSGSVGLGSSTVPDPDLSSAVATYLDRKRLKNETDLKDSQKNVNNSQIKLNDYQGDLAHENSAFINEQNRQLQQYGPLKQIADIDFVRANTAKLMNDITNSNRYTNAQIENLKYQNASLAGSAKATHFANVDNKEFSEWIKRHPYLRSGGYFVKNFGLSAGLSGSAGVSRSYK